MIVLSIHNKGDLYKDNQNIAGSDNNTSNIVDDMIKHKKHVFILIYMEGCGPCNATRPEWAKMASTLKKQYANNKDVAIIDMNKDCLPLIKNVGSVDGFPTMKYITSQGKSNVSYENSSVKNKDRSVDSFINWIESIILKGKIVSVTPKTSAHHVYKRISKSYSNSHSKSHSKSRTKKRKIIRKGKGKSKRVKQ
jgi:thiol-disulfide isomerase/thioredoxin